MGEIVAIGNRIEYYVTAIGISGLVAPINGYGSNE